VLYRQWVLDAGGAIRGDVPTEAADAAEAAARAAVISKGGEDEDDDAADDESKEVVDLKYVRPAGLLLHRTLDCLWSHAAGRRLSDLSLLFP
jgi:hypothetical protein